MIEPRLLFFASAYIEDFLAEHPVQWLDRELAERGGVGDRAGRTPTPAAREFFEMLHNAGTLFTQAEYAERCLRRWKTWFEQLAPPQQRGVRVKLFNNFYPSLMDSLHVMALLAEARRFDTYLIDARMDVLDKVDLTLMWDGKLFRVALVGPTAQAQDDRHYKITHRPGAHDEVVHVVRLPPERPRGAGNKRWFELQDFAFLWAENP